MSSSTSSALLGTGGAPKPPSALSKLDGNPVLAAGEMATGANNNRKSRNSNKEISQESDSFQKHYNKEIKVNQEEIPIVLNELVDAAYNYIQRESYEKALVLLQKTEGVLEVVSLESSRRDKYIAYATFHNMAMCYQKLGMLEECYLYLHESLMILTAPMPKGQYFYKFSSENCVAARMKQIKQECKLKLQLCAILSQTQNHVDALDNSKKSVKLIHQLFKDLLMLCALYMNKIEKKDAKKKKKLVEKLQKKASLIHDDEDEIELLSAERPDMTEEKKSESASSTPSNGNFLEESISMLERTSMKLYPVVKEVLKRMINEQPKEALNKEGSEDDNPFGIDVDKLLSTNFNEESSSFMLGAAANGAADMRSVLGFLNQNEWVYALNIGNIMQLQAVNLRTDLLSQCRNECELSRDSFLEKIALLGVAYFCVSTEMRFILQSREQYLSSPIKRQRELESEYWHAKSLEIACSFLPSECPLLNHILLSYQKHHDPSLQPIKEDHEQTDVLSVIRPLPGIESNKYQPIVRQITSIKVAITPCQISPITKRIFKFTSGQNHESRVKNVQKADEDTHINQKLASNKEDSAILMYDQQEQQVETGVNLNPEGGEKKVQSPATIKEEHQIECGPREQQNTSKIAQSQSLYSDEYYDQFVKRMFDDNPQLDKKQLVSKILSHLQSQDYSFLQRQINEQQIEDDEDSQGDMFAAGEEECEDIDEVQRRLMLFWPGSSRDSPKREKKPVRKEQRSTIMHFKDESALLQDDDYENDDKLQDNKGENDDTVIDPEDIVMIDKKFDRVKSLQKKHQNLKLPTADIAQREKQKKVEKELKKETTKSSGNNSSVPSSVPSSKYIHNNIPNKINNASHSSVLQNQLETEARKKKREPNRVQKLMSYLEGDSLLKDIERSLGNYNRVILDNDEEIEEGIMVPVNHQKHDSGDSSKIKAQSIKSGNEIGGVRGSINGTNSNSSERRKKQLRPLELADMTSEDNEEDEVLNKSLPQLAAQMIQQNHQLSSPEQQKDKISGNASLLKSVSSTNKSIHKNNKANISKGGTQQSNLKSSNSLTRPSSSITNHTSATGSGIARRRSTAHQFLSNVRQQNINGLKKHQRNRLNPSQFQSQQHQHSGLLGRENCESPISVESEDKEKMGSVKKNGGAFSSITAEERKSKSRLSKERQQTKSFNQAFSINQPTQNRSKQRRTTEQAKANKKYDAHAAQKSRQSSVMNHNHFKSIGHQVVKQQVRTSSKEMKRPATAEKVTSNSFYKRNERMKSKSKSKSSEKILRDNSRSSSKNQRNLTETRQKKRRANSGQSVQEKKDLDSITPLANVQQLTQPSFFSDHTSNTGSKIIGGLHNYSFDASQQNNSRINQASSQPQRTNNKSMSNLQQQVLFNQRLLLQFQQQQISQGHSRQKASANIINNTGGKLSQNQRSRQHQQSATSDIEQKQFNAPGNASMESSTGTNNKRASYFRSKSVTGQGGFVKRNNGSMINTTTTAQVNTSLNKIMQHFEVHDKTESNASLLPNHDSFIHHNLKSSNKENQTNANKISGYQTQQYKKVNGTSAAHIQKKLIKELTSGLMAHQQSISREKREVSNLRLLNQQQVNHEQKSFFDNNSPQLLHKNSKNKTGSSSPHKKYQKSSKSQQKIANDLRNIIAATQYNAISRQAGQGGSGIIYSTADNRVNRKSSNKKRMSQSSLKNAGHHKQLMSSFMNQIGIQENGLISTDHPMHSQSQWWLQHESNLSFDQRSASRGGARSALGQHPNDIHRPSFGIGQIHRDSTDSQSLMQASGLKKAQQMSLHSFTSHPQNNSQTQIDTKDIRMLNKSVNKGDSSVHEKQLTKALITTKADMRNAQNSSMPQHPSNHQHHQAIIQPPTQIGNNQFSQMPVQRIVKKQSATQNNSHIISTDQAQIINIKAKVNNLRA